MARTCSIWPILATSFDKKKYVPAFWKTDQIVTLGLAYCIVFLYCVYCVFYCCIVYIHVYCFVPGTAENQSFD